MTPASSTHRIETPRPTLSPDDRAIARTVLYSALFDYPLTLAQLRQALIESEQTPTDILTAYEGGEALRRLVTYVDGYFFPHGRHDLVAERRRREARSRAFLSRHRLVLRLIAAMPYVKMVALSGSIAHLNLDARGDLDLFIITRGSRVWSVTVATVLLAKAMRRRQTVCANFVVADSALSVGPEDLFTASQIIHLKPLLGNATYRRFLAANRWVGRFYPNFHAAAPNSTYIRQGALLRGGKRLVEWLFAVPSKGVELACRTAYGAYLRRRSATWSSPEGVHLGRDHIKLHTHSHRRTVLARFDAALAALHPEVAPPAD